MREYIFRGKQKAGDWIGDWIFGDLIYYSDCKHASIRPDEEHCWPVDPDSVGQFTTQTDNNGKDIYEGDILRVGSQIGTVVYDCDSFNVAFGCGNTSLFRCLLEKPCVVIGNVHDSPELLEGKDA